MKFLQRSGNGLKVEGNALDESPRRVTKAGKAPEGMSAIRLKESRRSAWIRLPMILTWFAVDARAVYAGQ